MPSIGQTLAGRYRLDARIGSGGFATVFRARDLRLDRDVALKVLLADHATDAVGAERFDREARVLAAIDHPNVIAIHDVEPAEPATDSGPFLVMDLCDGGSLADRLAASPTGSLPPQVLVPILADVAAGLDALHSRGIVHRDLKPSNILLAEGRARIADLGIAADGPSDLTATGTMVGTLAYLAPEQLAGEAASPASDVHALGVVACLGLTGQLPRPTGSVNEIVAGSARAVSPVSLLAPGLGTAFDTAIEAALDVEPARRPSAMDFARALNAAVGLSRTGPTPVAADDATTLAALPVPSGAERQAQAAPAGARRDRTLPVVLPLVAAVILAAVVLLLSGVGGAGDRASPSLAAGGGSGSGPSASASAPPSPSPSPSASPIVTPAPATDPFADAVAASTEMRAAIGSARGKGGLKGKETKDLDSLLDQFDRAVRARDAGAAREAAGRLAGEVDGLIDRGAVDAQVAERLRTAVDRLVDAAGALPG